MCHWGNENKEYGFTDGGWSALYMKCKLYEIPAVQKLSGSAMITEWCDSKKNVANWKCLEDNASQCWYEPNGSVNKGWNQIYTDCKLYEIHEVNLLHGEEAVNAWCA